jgi:hypothetical protein
MFANTLYLPLVMISWSFRAQSLRKVGKAATRIQTWKCSSSRRLGNPSTYPFGYRLCQLGGGRTSDGES